MNFDPLFSENVTWTFANSTQTDAAVAALTPLSSNIVAEPAYAQPAVVLAPGKFHPRFRLDDFSDFFSFQPLLLRRLALLPPLHSSLLPPPSSRPRRPTSPLPRLILLRLPLPLTSLPPPSTSPLRPLTERPSRPTSHPLPHPLLKLPPDNTLETLLSTSRTESLVLSVSSLPSPVVL